MREPIPNNRYVSNTFLEFSDLTQHLDKFIGRRAILGKEEYLKVQNIIEFIYKDLNFEERKDRRIPSKRKRPSCMTQGICNKVILAEGLEDIAQFISNTLDIGECKIYGLQNLFLLEVSFVERRESADMECWSLFSVLLDIMESYINGNVELYHGNERDPRQSILYLFNGEDLESKQVNLRNLKELYREVPDLDKVLKDSEDIARKGKLLDKAQKDLLFKATHNDAEGKILEPYYNKGLHKLLAMLLLERMRDANFVAEEMMPLCNNEMKRTPIGLLPPLCFGTKQLELTEYSKRQIKENKFDDLRQKLDYILEYQERQKEQDKKETTTIDDSALDPAISRQDPKFASP